MTDTAPGAHGESGLTRGAVDLQRYTHSLMGTYGVPMRVLARGEGSWVWDADGNRYLDLLGGIAVNALGHAHPAWVAAIAHQAATLAQASNFFATEPQIRLAERLLDLAQAPPGSRVFFANSGTEANEAAFKMARRTGKGTVIALTHGFHGRSMGALSMTDKEAIRAPFAPLLDRVIFVDPTDEPGLRDAVAAVADDLAAIILEPIQGESGIHPVSHAELASLYPSQVCDHRGSGLLGVFHRENLSEVRAEIFRGRVVKDGRVQNGGDQSGRPVARRGSFPGRSGGRPVRRHLRCTDRQRRGRGPRRDRR